MAMVTTASVAGSGHHWMCRHAVGSFSSLQFSPPAFSWAQGESKMGATPGSACAASAAWLSVALVAVTGTQQCVSVKVSAIGHATSQYKSE